MQGDLSGYDAIITGVRAYNTQERLRYWQPRLLEYVKNGGTLLIQYNTNGGLVTNQLGPFPFTLSRDRVTDEHAAVTFLKPEDKLMTYPNALTTADFNGWVQERGLYFTANADGQYMQPFSMKDPGKRPFRLHAGGPLREREVCIYRPVVLPPAACRRAGRLPFICEPDR